MARLLEAVTLWLNPQGLIRVASEICQRANFFGTLRAGADKRSVPKCQRAGLTPGVEAALPFLARGASLAIPLEAWKRYG